MNWAESKKGIEGNSKWKHSHVVKEGGGKLTLKLGLWKSFL
jgi:hypothetical protein